MFIVIQKYIVCGIVAFLLMSCKSGYVPFTKSMYKELVKNNVSLKDIQFYNSKDFYVYQTFESDEKKAESGKIAYSNVVTNDKKIIKKYTPGVFNFSRENNNYLNIHFGKNTLLTFLASPVETEAPFFFNK